MSDQFDNSYAESLNITMYNFRLRSISLVVGYTLPIQAQRVIGLALVDDHIVLFPLYKNGLLAIISEERSSFLLEDLHTFTTFPSVQDLWLHSLKELQQWRQNLQ